MFFSISKQPDHRFPCQTDMGSWIVNHDNGWIQTAGSLRKGYFYQTISHGNFCEIKTSGDRIVIGHDHERSYPLWWNQETLTLTNCFETGQKLWTDDRVQLTDDGIVIEKTDIIGPIDESPLTSDQAVALLDKRFADKFRALKTEPLPLKIFVTGGIDTACLYSYLLVGQIKFDLITYEYFDYDHFTNNFASTLRETHWAYKQMHHWNNPCILLTGACGDEYMFRGPAIIAKWAAWHQIDIISLIEKHGGYHSAYFLKVKNRKIFQTELDQQDALRHCYPTKTALMRHLIDINLNDHQHWHLGHTLTWTPFMDIELFKIMMRLDQDSLINQWTNAEINRKLISRDCLQFISTYKNHHPRHKL